RFPAGVRAQQLLLPRLPAGSFPRRLRRRAGGLLRDRRGRPDPQVRCRDRGDAARRLRRGGRDGRGAVYGDGRGQRERCGRRDLLGDVPRRRRVPGGDALRGLRSAHHDRPLHLGGRTIQPGEHVFLEVGGCFRRYHAAMMRTVVNGELSESMHSAQELMKHALAELRSLMRPGVTVSEVDELTRSIIESNDVGATLVTRAGYSIGIAFPPSWDEGYILSLMEGDPRPLEPGMTFHLIPWMWGVDGNKTVGISDTVRITEDGCQS